MTGPCRPVPPARTPPHETHGHPDRLILAEWTGHGGSIPIRTTTPATTLDKVQSPSVRDPHPHPHSGVKHPTKGDTKHPTKGDTNQSWALISETLSAELEGRVPAEVGVAPQDHIKAAQHRDVADIGLTHRRAHPESDLVVLAISTHGIP